MTAPEDVRLNEFEAEEWFDVCRQVKPGYTWEQFEKDWAEFAAMKAEVERQRAMN